jgi:hypothetical protein
MPDCRTVPKSNLSNVRYRGIISTATHIYITAYSVSLVEGMLTIILIVIKKSFKF